jgi:hypothetical protein
MDTDNLTNSLLAVWQAGNLTSRKAEPPMEMLRNTSQEILDKTAQEIRKELEEELDLHKDIMGISTLYFLRGVWQTFWQKRGER